MDLNMVRAGVVGHPSQWVFSGYYEILAPRKRYALIDYRGLRELLNFTHMNELVDAYRGWLEESLHADDHHREGKWTESVAVGSERFVTAMKERLGIKVKGREVSVWSWSDPVLTRSIPNPPPCPSFLRP
jgi:hypothetical protein